MKKDASRVARQGPEPLVRRRAYCKFGRVKIPRLKKKIFQNANFVRLFGLAYENSSSHIFSLLISDDIVFYSVQSKIVSYVRFT